MSAAKVGRDLVLRGVLIWSGIALYDHFAKVEDPKRFQRSLAAAGAIEFFVLVWTAARAPRR